MTREEARVTRSAMTEYDKKFLSWLHAHPSIQSITCVRRGADPEITANDSRVVFVCRSGRKLVRRVITYLAYQRMVDAELLVPVLSPLLPGAGAVIEYQTPKFPATSTV